MKSSPLVILSIFSFVSLHAQSPITEEFPSPSATLQYALTNEESASLNEDLIFLDDEADELEENVALLDESFTEAQEKKEAISIPSLPAAPSIHISAPFDNTKQSLPLSFSEEKIPIGNLEGKQDHSEPAITPDHQILFRESTEKPFFDSESPGILTIESSSSDIKNNLDVKLDLKRAFGGSPLIYTLLFGMSIFSVSIWIFSIMSLKKISSVPQHLLGTLHSNLNGNHFDEALSLCNSQNTLLCRMVASGIQSRKYGLSAIIESMKAEGKRSSMNFWQKIGLLNDVAILAPMLGLLGTVLGMFYAFYDVNRSMESITTLFDGLGISVGTTVAGLVVAILALILHSTAKYRLIRVLSQAESEAHGIAALIDSHVSLYEESK